MAKSDALPAAFHRRLLSSAFLPPLLLWAMFCAALGGGVAAYLRGASTAATEGIYARAEASAALAEHTLLHAFEAARGVHDLLQMRQKLLEADEAPSAHAVQAHVKRLVDAGRFGIVQAGLTDRAGNGAWGTGNNIVGLALGDREHIRVHLDGRAHLAGTDDGLFISHPLLGRTTGRWSIQTSRPVRDRWGGVVGVGVVSLDPVALSRSLGLNAGGSAHVAIVRRLADGAMLARSRDIESRLGQPAVPDHPALIAARRAPTGRLAYRAPDDGREVIGVYRVAEDLPLVAIAVFAVAEERAQFLRVAAAMAVAALAAMALGLQFALSWARGRRLRQRLQVEAARDPLTGLLNRRALQAQAAPLFAAAQAACQPLAVLLIDLDHFKAINDTHGHAVGDAVLRDVAAVLEREIRRDDLACRWGGEEMLAVLRNCGPDGAEARAAALRAAIAAARPGGVPGLRVTASIGVAAFPDHGAGLDELTERADTALYAAKRAGRDRVVCAMAA